MFRIGCCLASKMEDKIMIKVFLLFFTLFLPMVSLTDEVTKNTEPTPEQQLELAFFYGARNGDIELITTFLDAGVNIDYQNAQGYSALMVAAFRGQKVIIKELLSRNANTCLEDKRGNTALMAAIVSAELLIAKDLMAYDCNSAEKVARTKEFATMFGQTEILELLNKK